MKNVALNSLKGKEKLNTGDILANQNYYFQNTNKKIIRLQISNFDEHSTQINLDEVGNKDEKLSSGSIIYITNPKQSDEILLKTIITDPPGEGLGPFLLKQLINHLKSTNCKSIRTLTTAPSAMAFYKNMGFEGDDTTAMVSGNVKDKTGNTLSISGRAEWIATISHCEAKIDDYLARTADKRWFRLGDEYAQILNPLIKMGGINKEFYQALVNDPEGIIPITSVKMTEMTVALMDEIKQHIEQIQSSNLTYRYKAKQAKCNVLTACLNYLNGKGTKENLESYLTKFPDYTNAFGKSITKEIVNQVLNINENIVNEINKHYAFTQQGYIIKKTI